MNIGNNLKFKSGICVFCRIRKRSEKRVLLKKYILLLENQELICNFQGANNIRILSGI
jgi:hypothetical protein